MGRWLEDAHFLAKPKDLDFWTPPTCSFCGKKQDEVKKIISGPSVRICDECVALCNDIIESQADASPG